MAEERHSNVMLISGNCFRDWLGCCMSKLQMEVCRVVLLSGIVRSSTAEVHNLLGPRVSVYYF